jgi:hypothetical protein
MAISAAKNKATPAEYVFKLWMGNGSTTIRDPSCGNGLDWVLEEKKIKRRK